MGRLSPGFSSPSTDFSGSASASKGQDGVLERLISVRPEAWLRQVPGRETFRWCGTSEAPAAWVVKRYTSLPGPVSRLVLRRRRPPAEVEFENLTALAAIGLRVPAALGCYASGPHSVVVMEEVPHRLDLRQRLTAAQPPEARELGQALLELVVRLHERGWYHRDLYLQHFLLPERPDEPPLCLIDVGRARHEPGARSRWFVKDLAALLHSCPASVSPALRLRFLAGYLRRLGPSARGAKRAFARRVLSKARRMAAHRPRYGEDPTR